MRVTSASEKRPVPLRFPMVARVGTHTVPASAMASRASPERYAPCSTESTPASAAARTAWVPLAWAMTAKPCPMSDADHLPDLLGLQGAAGEDAEAVKVHEAGDHDFDKIPALCADLLDQGLVRFHGVEAPADEAAVVAPLVDGGRGGSGR